MQNPRNKSRVRLHIRQLRAVAQLGRAPGSGRAAEKYPYFLSRALTCFFIGKLIERALSQVFSNDPKKYHRWIKKWTKSERIKIAPEPSKPCKRPKLLAALRYTPLLTLLNSVIQLSHGITQNCAALQPKILRP
jgi:hypothetical protein